MHNMPNTGWELVPGMGWLRQIRHSLNLQRADDDASESNCAEWSTLLLTSGDETNLTQGSRKNEDMEKQISLTSISIINTVAW